MPADKDAVGRDALLHETGESLREIGKLRPHIKDVPLDGHIGLGFLQFIAVLAEVQRFFGDTFGSAARVGTPGNGAVYRGEDVFALDFVYGNHVDLL